MRWRDNFACSIARAYTFLTGTKDIMVYLTQTSLKAVSVPIVLARVTGHQILNLWISWMLRLPFVKIMLLILIICKEL